MSAAPETLENISVNIEINGETVKARRGDMLIEAADEAGISIPRFCYHKKLSIAANCRMCLVEVDKVPKPLPACATPVTEGMKVFTTSHKAIEAQQGVMEFLLVNHPLDCPICDQGGECELQEISVGYGGMQASQFGEEKRVVGDKDIGTLITTEMTRCIHCTRCVRFGDEIAGVRELGAVGRGENLSIGTYIQKSLKSEMSGNVIDLCPVGALTSKPFRYTARAWEMNDSPSISPHDCAGSSTNVKVRRDQVMRIDPRENESINEVWLSDRDRFSYEALNGDDRLTVPMIKQDGYWQETDWSTALEATVKGIQAASAGKIGALVSPSATIEEMYLLQKLVRGLGSSNIDHRLHQIDFSAQENDPSLPWLGEAISSLDNTNAALLIGSYLRKEQPIINHRLRTAARAGADVMVVNPVDYDFNYSLKEKIISSLAGMEHALAAIAKASIALSGKDAPKDLTALIASATVEAPHKNIAETLSAGKQSTVLLGTLSTLHPAYSTLRALASVIAEHTGASLGYLTAGANSAGAVIAGAQPHRGVAAEAQTATGLNAASMMEQPLDAYILLGVEPELDCANAATSINALKGSFVVSLTPFVSDAMKEYADVLLPVSAHTETSGTFVNIEGNWQSFTGSVPPKGEARPAWKVLRVFGNLFKQPGFDYVSSDEVRDELASAAAALKPSNEMSWRCPQKLSALETGVTRIADLPGYAVDSIVRRAASLQSADDRAIAIAYLSAETAADNGLQGATAVSVTQSGVTVTVPLSIDERVAKGCLLLATGLGETAGMDLGNITIDLAQAELDKVGS